LGDGRVPTPYNDEFFHWWRRNIITIDDYSYEGIDYRGDHDMPLPLGSAFGEIGKNLIFLYFIFCVFLFDEWKQNANIFVWYHMVTFISFT
jgi:hypothetical protein